MRHQEDVQSTQMLSSGNNDTSNTSEHVAHTDPSSSSAVSSETEGRPIANTVETDALAALGDFRIYSPPRDVGTSDPGNLPANFFEPTAADLKAAQESLSSKTRALSDAPLMTQKLREDKDKEKRNRWPTIRIRIRFADRTQLEKVFPSGNKIRSVYAFVRACLREDVQPHKFVLYQTPPRRDLKVSDPAVKDKTLYDLQLAPSSVLWFRFLEEELDFDTPSTPPPLLPQILSRIVDLPAPLLPDSTPAAQASRNTPVTSDTKAKISGKIPKWFKAGQTTEK